MFIQNYNDAPELDVLRKHNFLLCIKGCAEELVNSREDMELGPITANQTERLEPFEKLIVAMDINRGNLLENCKNRAYIKYKMTHALENERITLQTIKHEYRSYMLECVILFDRLSNLLGMLNDCYTAENISFTENEEHLLGFFNPLVNDFRNINIHEYYDSHFSWENASRLENEIHNKRFTGIQDIETERKLFEELSKIISEHLNWFKLTEDHFSKFLDNFFSLLADKLIVSEALLLPKSMPENFKVKYQRKDSLRRQGRHSKVFNSINTES
jgi:hypothetical protein